MKKKLSQVEIAAGRYTVITSSSTSGAIIPASGTPLQSQNWYVPSPQEAAYQKMKADILEEVLAELKKGLIAKGTK